MKNLIILIWLIISTACGTTHIVSPPIGVSMFPKTIDLDLVLPEKTTEIVPVIPGAKRFSPIIVKGGDLCFNKICTTLPAGFLIDEQTFAQQLIADQSTLKRVQTELKLLKNLRNQELILFEKGELAYQTRINQLETRDESWWQQNKGTIIFISGFVLGGIIVIGTAATLDLTIN